MTQSSKIFTGYRALGFISNHVPLAIRYHHKHKENYITTCVGKEFHTYNCSRLGIVSVSNAHPDEITCLAVDARYVYTSCKNVVRAFTRGRQVAHEYCGHGRPVHLLLPFGAHLLSVDTDSYIKVWDVESEECYSELQFDNETFQVTCLLHPSTYVNKILLASQQGSLQLWNLRTHKSLYTFQGWSAPVTVLEQAPAVDVVAVGLADGQVILHNIKFDETVMKFRQDWGPITTISFRTDGHPILATGSTVGHIALWNLEEKKLQSQIRDAHTSSVAGMKCLPSEPLMVTSSPDNSLKVWIFDLPDGGGRLLRERSGHSAPPNKVSYYDKSGQNILTAGQDSTLRSFSTVHERHNKSLGRASYNKAESKRSGLKYDQHMMPAIIDFASEPSRDSDWESIVACHRGETCATTWSYKRHTMGAHRLQHDRVSSHKDHEMVTAQCCSISSCGNFAVIGYSSGHVDQYNLQSGLHRGTYGSAKAHKGTVRGVAIDGLNQLTLTGGADCCVKFWKFKSKELLHSVTLESQIAKMLLHRESGMLVVGLDDFRLSVLDIDTCRVVRVFTGHQNSITDLAFSPDSRWLISSSMDSTLRTWDLPTGRLIDCFMVDEAVTSVDMSPTSDFLVTTHVDDLGVYLWSNKTLYTHVPLRPLPADYEPKSVELPSTRATQQCSEGTLGTEDEEDEDEDGETVARYKTPEQLSDELVTLSLLPNSRWQNLLNLDIIKQRNRPKEPPRVPKAAPFFLPTVAGLEPKFVEAVEDITVDQDTVNTATSNMLPLSEFGQLLQKACYNKSYAVVLNRLKEIGPSAIDVELRMLGPEGGGSVQLMAQFLLFVDHILKTNKDFELAQAYLGLFLKLHGELLSTEPELTEALKSIQDSQQLAWINMQTLFNQNLCLVNFMKSAAL